MKNTLNGLLFTPGEKPQIVEIEHAGFADKACQIAKTDSLSLFKSADEKVGIFLDQFAYEEGIFNCLIDDGYLIDEDDMLADGAFGLRIFKEQGDVYPIWGSFIAVGLDKNSGVCDLSKNEYGKILAACTDPLKNYKPSFRRAFSRYITWDVNQEQAAEIAQISQSQFSVNIRQIADSNSPLSGNTEPVRGLKPIPKGFDELCKQYTKGNISARVAAQKLGVSHPTFLKYVAEADHRLHLDSMVSRMHESPLNFRNDGHAKDFEESYSAER